MVAVLDELELTALVTSITGISAVGAATILAETGDPNRFATARALVKHAGLAPREKSSGTFTGRTKLTGQGRPGHLHRPDQDSLPDLTSWRRTNGRPGRALRGIEDHRVPRRSSWAAPPVVSPTPLHAAGHHPHTALQGQTTDEAPAKGLAQNDLR
jgi:hypothetical protein